MTARHMSPIQMALAFSGAAGNLPPENLEAALLRFAKLVIEGHPDFLLHADTNDLTLFFRHITGIAGTRLQDADRKKGDAVAAFVNTVTKFVARNGEDADVTKFHEALQPVDFAPVRNVVDAGLEGHRRMRRAYNGELTVRPNRFVLQV